jgi:hypothetical protein
VSGPDANSPLDAFAAGFCVYFYFTGAPKKKAEEAALAVRPEALLGFSESVLTWDPPVAHEQFSIGNGRIHARDAVDVMRDILVSGVNHGRPGLRGQVG